MPNSPTLQSEPSIRVRNVARWYGEILGINKVTVDLAPGITGLVGPNGSGKSTLLNMLAGILRPGRGEMTILGQSVWNNPELRRRVGYCSQVDKFYENFSGLEFLASILKLHGRGKRWAEATALEALARVGMTEHQDRPIRAYSKGMRQRVKIALAIAHGPEVVLFDEPFNGLDPVGRREMIQLLLDYDREGRTILISSHILQEVEQMTGRILMMSNGYVMAEGEVREVRDQLRSHPFEVVIRCNEPRRLAAIMLREDGVRSIRIESETSVALLTNDPDHFYTRLNDVVLGDSIEIASVTLADENIQSIYRYLSGREHH